MTRPVGVRRTLAASSVVLVLLVSGCGSSESAADRVPQLGDQLAQVDDALADGRWGEARQALDDIEQTTADAVADGDLSDAQADEVDRAVAALRAALRELRARDGAGSPTSEPTEEPSDEPTEDATSEAPPTDDDPGEEQPPEDEGPGPPRP